MKKLSLALLSLTVLLGGCLTTPVSNSGGLSAVTIPNTSRIAIIRAAQDVFAQSGYTGGPTYYNRDEMSFEKPANKFGQLMWGSFDQSTTVRVVVDVVRIPGTATHDYRVSAHATVVNDAGQPGFESSRKLAPMWSAQFGPLLGKIKAQAANAGHP